MQPNLRALVEDHIQDGLSLEAIGEELSQAQRQLYESTEFNFARGGALGRKVEGGLKDYAPVWWAQDKKAREWVIKTLESGERIHPTIFANEEMFLEWLNWHHFLGCKNSICLAEGKPDPKEFGDGEDDLWKFVCQCTSELRKEPTADPDSPTSMSAMQDLQSMPIGFLEEEDGNGNPDDGEEMGPWELFMETRSMPPRDHYNIVALTTNRVPDGLVAAQDRQAIFADLRIELEDCILPFQVAQFRADLKEKRGGDIALIEEWGDEQMELLLADKAKEFVGNGSVKDEERLRRLMGRERGRFMARRRQALAQGLYLTSAQWRRLDELMGEAWDAADDLWKWMQSPEGKRKRRMQSNGARDSLVIRMKRAPSRSGLKFLAKYASTLNYAGILWSGDHAQVKSTGSKLWKAHGRRSR
jgi:hypothetical protein